MSLHRKRQHQQQPRQAGPEQHRALVARIRLLLWRWTEVPGRRSPGTKMRKRKIGKRTKDRHEKKWCVGVGVASTDQTVSPALREISCSARLYICFFCLYICTAAPGSNRPPTPRCRQRKRKGGVRVGDAAYETTSPAGLRPDRLTADVHWLRCKLWGVGSEPVGEFFLSGDLLDSLGSGHTWELRPLPLDS